MHISVSVHKGRFSSSTATWKVLGFGALVFQPSRRMSEGQQILLQ